MDIEEFVDKIEDLVYEYTPDIESLEDVMTAIKDELNKRWAFPSKCKIPEQIEVVDGK